MTKKQMTKNELFLWKVHNDPVFYIENFLKIKDKNSKLVPFTLNDGQKQVMEAIKKNEKEGNPHKYIILKARQMGMSTLIQGLIFHNTTTNQYKNSMIVSYEDKSTQNLFGMSKLFYDELPTPIKPMLRHSNERALTFENSDNNERSKNPGLRSKMTVATAGSTNVGRSSTIHNLHVSEVAFFEKGQDTMLGLLQAVPDTNDSMVFLESTANGVGDFFHEFWQKTVKGENEFTPIFLPWFTEPQYARPFRTEGERKQLLDEINTTTTDSNGSVIKTYEKELMEKHNLTLEQLNWRRWTIKNKTQGDEDLFGQEYPATPEEAFLSSGRPVFNIKSLKKYQTITKEPLKRGYLRYDNKGDVTFIEDKKGYVSIWQDPNPDKNYVLGADVAEGLEHGDYSCGKVADTETFDEVAKWHGHIDADLFGEELVKLARYYNDAYLGVENNNHGLTTLSTIKRMEYWNLYFSKNYDRIADTMTQKLGWTTNTKTKPLMIDKLAEFVREIYLGLYDDDTISEMFTYVIDEKGKTNAQAGCHDDTVMASAITLQLLLEGKGDTFVPEIPIDQRSGRQIKEVVDPLFEGEEAVEYSV